MRKTICAILCAAILLGLCACGRTKAPEQTAQPDVPSATPANASNEAGMPSQTETPESNNPTNEGPSLSEPTPPTEGEPSNTGADIYKEAMQPYFDVGGDILGAFQGTSLLPGFDIDVLLDAGFQSQFEGGQGVGVAISDSETGTALILFDRENMGTLESLNQTGCYGFDIRANAISDVIDVRFTFHGLYFGADEIAVLGAYKVAPDESTTGEHSWQHTWVLNDYYTFTVIGSKKSGLNEVILRAG